MSQDNPLLVRLKQRLHPQTPCAEGVVEATEKGSGFPEADTQRSYFIPPPQMKEVMHSDRIIVVIHGEKERESTEPEELAKPFLTRFMGKVQGRNDRLAIASDHPLLKDAIPCRAARGLNHEFKKDDWVVAEMCRHPLKGDRSFYVGLIRYITLGDGHFVSQWVTSTRHSLGKEAPDGVATEMLDEGLAREGLTASDFAATDNASTEDMDGALFAKVLPDDEPQLIVATADSTAWIVEGSKLDKAAKICAFTSYLPGFNTPMLSRELFDDLCSLHASEVRPVLAYRMTLSADGTIEDDTEFSAATIEPRARLVYDQVPDWLENIGDWQPESEAIAEQVCLLAQICQRRGEQCHNHALVFKDRPDCRFIFGEKDEVLDIVAEPRRIANRIVEEAMTVANICAAHVSRDKPGFGIYNVYTGSDLASADALAALLKTYGPHVDTGEVLTLDGPCKLRREPDAQLTGFLGSRIRRFQPFAKTSIEPGPHFGLGPEAYATQTSSIRKYGDTINHHLLKAVIKGETTTCPQNEIIVQVAERRRLSRMAGRDVGDWLYARFPKDKAGTDTRLVAEIVDISRSGMRVRLVDSGAIAFIPAPFLYAVCNELVRSRENGVVQIEGETVYKVADVIDVTIAEVRMETRSTIARPVA